MTDENSGVNSAARISPIANTAAKAAMIDNSQLSFKKSPTTGNSLTKGCADLAKRKARNAAPTQPTMAIASRVKPRE